MATPKTPGRKASRASDPKDVDSPSATSGGDEALSPETWPADPQDPVAEPANAADAATQAPKPDPDPQTASATGAAPDAEQPAETTGADEVSSAEPPPPSEPATDPQDSAPQPTPEEPSGDGDKAKSAPDPTPAPPPTPAPAPARSGGGGAFTLLLGGVAAAVLGFVMARYVLPEGWPVPGASPLQAQIERQATELQALREQLASLDTAPDLTPVETQIATLREDLAQVREAAEAARHAAATAANTPAAMPEEMTEQLDQLTARIDRLESRPDQPDGLAAVEDIAGLEAAIAALREGLAAQEARTAAAAEAARAEIERMQAEAEAARLATEVAAEGTLQQAALSQIEAALLNGTPFAEPLAVLAGAGHDIAPVLTDNAESGLPTLVALAERFDEPARAAIAAELRSDMGDTLGDRIGSFLRAQTGARSLSPRDGADADAVLSRTEAALRSGDLDRALAEIAALSEPAAAEMSGWVLQAERHRDAAAALAALAATVTEG